MGSLAASPELKSHLQHVDFDYSGSLSFQVNGGWTT
jgi:hypothetical protein